MKNWGRIRYLNRVANEKRQDERSIEVYEGTWRVIECLRCEKKRKIKTPNRVCDRCKNLKDFDPAPELRIIR